MENDLNKAFVLPTDDSFRVYRGDDGGWTLSVSFSPKTFEAVRKLPEFHDFLLLFMALFNPRDPPERSS